VTWLDPVGGSKWGFRGLLALVTLLLLVDAARIPLLDPDEARFARTSLEMLRSGDLVVPQFEGRPRLVKPPLMHWIQAALFGAVGPLEWVARLHSVAATVGLLALSGWIARRRLGDEGALWVAAFLATMPLVIWIGHLGTLDALLAVHVFAYVALDLVEPAEPRALRPVAAGLILGLGFLIKGPVGVILPLLISLAGRTATGRNVVPSPGAALAALAGLTGVVAPWALAFVGRLGWSGALDLLTTESIDRYFAADAGQRRPGWFFLGVATLGFAPWFGAAVAAIPGLARREYRTSIGRYAAAGLAVGLVFFSLGGGKRTSYVLPLAPLVAFVAAAGLARELDDPRRSRWCSRLVLVSMAGLAAALATAGITRLEGALRTAALAGAAIHGMAVLAGVHGFVNRRPRVVFGAAAAACGLFTLLAGWVVLPEVAARRSAAGVVAAVPELRSGRHVAVVDMKVPSLTFYLDAVPELVDLADLERRLAQADGTLYVFDRADVRRVAPEALRVLVELGGEGKYQVYERRPGGP